MELHVESFSVTQTIDDVVKTVETLAAKNANRVVTDCSPGLGLMHADQMRVRQALLNLLSNANKFTERGTVTINARQQDENGQSWITIAVTDSGIGMAARVAPMMSFDRREECHRRAQAIRRRHLPLK